ncbi:hypothetical protein BDQ17DRAFT_1280633 [Cyathus striatus]|nr:hypothetical protein BDQ17DRAFT_1280633 [Cyathus striatus]
MPPNLNGESSSELRSERFNKSDADVTFRSSDGVLFALHKMNLNLFTGGFPSADFKVEDEVIDLPEISTVLDLLFQFVYPQQLPSLGGVEFDTVHALALAAEKYFVYSAMGVCRAHMTYLAKCGQGDTKKIVKYAAIHSYLDILDEVAAFLVSVSLEDLESSITLFPVMLQGPWARYREQWMSIYRDTRWELVMHADRCSDSDCNLYQLSSALQVSREFKPVNLQNIWDFNGMSCGKCSCSKLKEWATGVQDRIKALHKFSFFCK